VIQVCQKKIFLTFSGGGSDRLFARLLLLPKYGFGGFAACKAVRNHKATSDDHSELEPRLPIPNRTVKRLSADDSADYPCESRTLSGTHSKSPVLITGFFFACYFHRARLTSWNGDTILTNLLGGVILKRAHQCAKRMEMDVKHKIIFSLLLISWSPISHAQHYPSTPGRIIVPFAAGGPADIYARFLGQRLQEPLGQTFIIENRAGAGSIIGTDLVAKSPADGYTLLLMSNTHTINESLIVKKPFSLMKDFAAVAPINYSDLLLVVHPSLPVKNVRLVKAKPRALNYASSGNGTPYHLAGEYFKSLTGVEITHVPHKGSSEARTSVMSGQVEIMIDAITTMTPLAKAGRVRALGSTGLKRSSVMPDLSTVAESGVPGYEATIWLGIMAPVNTPRAVLERLNGEITKVTSRAGVKKAWNEQGAEPIVMSMPEFERYLIADIAKWAKVVKVSGARPD
jgi:tripartite-type tricarboxylate transporter receptor subunit TctC